MKKEHKKVLNGLIESLDKKNFNKNINADNPCIVLNYEKYNPDNGKICSGRRYYTVRWLYKGRRLYI